MADSEQRLSIRIAGNTQIPALLALRVKGYTLKKWFMGPGRRDGQYDAEKDGRTFSATSPEELLGLIAMWEVRGDDWRWRQGEPDMLRELNAVAVANDAERDAEAEGEE